jgi:cadmium resistance transport/sequestration family protein
VQAAPVPGRLFLLHFEPIAMIQTLLMSVLAFVSTNIDDIFILMLFFGAKKIKPSRIIAGQYLGIATLVVLSLLGSFVGNFIDQRYIGILGLFPIFLAIKQVWLLVRPPGEDDSGDVTVTSASIFAVAGVTIANGADNIGVYVPLLATLSQFEKIQLVIVFMVMTYLWCLAGQYLASRPVVAKQLERFGHIIMPVVLFLLGLFILIESGTFELLVA